MLHPSLDLLAGETPTSLVARLAMLHDAPTARYFCLDMGLRFQAVVDGDEDTLAAVASLARVPLAGLGANAIHRTGGGFLLKGQELVRPSLRRSRVMVCPRCIAGDLARDAPPWMAGGRAEWLLDPIHSCPRHEVAFVEVARITDTEVLHDFARNVASALPEIRRLADAAIHVTPSALEAYLLGRLDGAIGPDWLDALPWHAAARACEMIGAVAAFGPRAAIKTFGDAEWRQAGATGFEIAAGGPDGIRAFLEGMRMSHPRGRVDNGGPQAWLGRLQMWLTDTQDEPAYAPLREEVIAFMTETVPLGPNEHLFGRQVVEHRRLHSIRTASLETGLHPKRLRRILSATDVIPRDHAGRPDDQVTFPAEDAAPILEKAKRCISHAEVATYLNAGRVQTALLAKAGFIRPFLASGTEALKDHAYDRAELDTFMADLSRDTVPVVSGKPPFIGIAEAAKRACCGAAEIVGLLLDRKLAQVRRLTEERGYAAILVNVDEVRRLIRGDRGDDLTLGIVQAKLRTSFGVVDALVKSGTLPSHRAISPLNRCPYLAVRKEALDYFQACYVSLQEISRERGTHFLALKKRLAVAGIAPAFDRSMVPATFYRRVDIPLVI